MLEKIKELRVKAECAKALLSLADDETEKKHFKKLKIFYFAIIIKTRPTQKKRTNFIPIISV